MNKKLLYSFKVEPWLDCHHFFFFFFFFLKKICAVALWGLTLLAVRAHQIGHFSQFVSILLKNWAPELGCHWLDGLRKKLGTVFPLSYPLRSSPPPPSTNFFEPAPPPPPAPPSFSTQKTHRPQHHPRIFERL